MTDNSPRFANVLDMLRHLGTDESILKDIEDRLAERREHAEVGALLARCCNYRVGEYEQGWFAEITLRNNETGSSDTFRDTQHAAIKAAVETAEKRIRE